MNSLQSVKDLLERLGETVVGFDLGQEEGVATELGLLKDEEEGGGGGLLLVGDVGVPLDASEAVVGEVFAEAVVVLVAVDDVEFGEALDITGSGVALDGTEVAEEQMIRFMHDLKEAEARTWQSQSVSRG